MRVTLTWDDAAPGADGTLVRWEFVGLIGLVDYIVPMNETAQKAIFADGDIDAILDMGWAMPFPNRPMLHLYHAIMAAPPALRTVVIASANPLTRGIIRWRLLQRSRTWQPGCTWSTRWMLRGR
jgi:hypothetical protein